ncbi:MAG: L-serine ammonia-lyase [Erysipelotrichaceae bacterium]|nr:L-serine ammonia-lyase [Erysipelotrichaceae bacterium]
MQAIRELYKMGRGPSSSHTLAPERACRLFTEVNGVFPYYRVELYGSLSLTGKGHCTDQVIIETLPSECEVVFCLDWDEEFPNGFYLRALDENKNEVMKWTVFSVGGGTIEIKEYPVDFSREIYTENSFDEIREILASEDISISEYVFIHEPGLREYLSDMIDGMCACVQRGLKTEGILPGKLQMYRSAAKLYRESLDISVAERNDLRLMAYAHAAGEENAAGNTCVTAPTLGACGVLAAMMYYCLEDLSVERDRLIDALAVGGLFGNLIKQNATISGAVGGCQAEVGAAVSMAAAAYAFLMNLNISQIEYAAEIGMEHHLGLTCDPVMGYVMIPCIERNAMGVLRAIDAAVLAKYMSRVRGHLVSFDMVVQTMNETGKSLPRELKETSEGGLAKEFEHGF